MHITHAKKGGKSHKKVKRKSFDAAKEKAVAEVAYNLKQEAKKIEMSAVTQVLEKHIGRKLTFEDIPLIERIATDNGYVLKYDGVMLGEVRRFHAKDNKSDNNYKVTFTPFD